MQHKQTTSASCSRYGYIDVLRLLSCILIIGVHVSAMNWGDAPVTSSKWQVMNICDCISLLGVPLFFMISGALLLSEQYSISLRDLFLRKILRLFFCYHIWLFFYNCLPFFSGELTPDFVTIKDEFFLKTLLGKGIYHLWFIPELIILYLVSPILKDAFRKKENCIYFLILFAITGAFLPTILTYDFPYRRIVNSYYERSSLVMLTGYIGYFVLGHFIHTFLPALLSRMKKAVLAIIIIVSCFITIVACSMDAVAKGEPSTILNTPFTILSFCSCTGIFLLAKCHGAEAKKLLPGIVSINKLTFGIYLIHPFVIKLLSHFNIGTLNPHPIIMIPVLTAVVFVLSAIPIYLISRIPILNKWII